MADNTSNRVVIVLNDDEMENFQENKKETKKTGQFLGYLALKDAGLLEKPKKKKKQNK